jgi:hypothetical protein
MDDNIVDLTKKSLEYYDNQNIKYKEYLENTQFEIKDSKFNILKDGNVILDGDFEIAGYFDFQTKVWINGWAIYFRIRNDTIDNSLLLKNKLSLELFNYINDNRYNIRSNMQLDNQIYNYIYDQLCNSRILIEDNMELDIFLGLISYLLKEKIKFIYPYIKYLNNDKTKYIIRYYYIL